MEVIGLPGLTAYRAKNGVNRGTKGLPDEARMILRSNRWIQCTAQRSGKCELIRIFESKFESTIPAHRQTGNPARSAIFDCAKARVHIGDQFADEVRLILSRRRSGAIRVPTIVSLRRDDDQIVISRIFGQAGSCDPIVVTSEQAMQKIEHRITLVRF